MWEIPVPKARAGCHHARMRQWLAAAGVFAISVATASGVSAETTEQQATRCAVGSRILPGGGPLEWQPSGSALVLPGSATAPAVKAGNVLVLTTTRDLRRYGLAAVDARTRRLLPFKVSLPAPNVPLALAASPTTVYVVYGPRGPAGPKAVRAYDLRSGKPRPAFRVAELDAEGTVFAGIAFARGRVVLAGRSGTGPGGILAAYDAASGKEIWRTDPGWAPQGLVTDGARLYVGVPKRAASERSAVAFDARTGKRVPGWGTRIRDDFDTEAKGIAGRNLVVWKTSAARTHTLLYSRAAGKPVSTPPAVKAGGEYLYGTSRAIVGLVRDRRQPAFGVYDARGKVIGTVCSRYVVLAQRDSRTLVAYESLPGNRTRLLWLTRE
jgi:hypothetical protein